MRSLLTLTIFLLLFACSTPAPIEQSFQVSYEGALKNIMHKGDLSAKASLAEYKNIPHLYALGAIENLKGEIQIFDSQAYHSIVQGDSIAFDMGFSKKATLFVSAVVEAWDSFSIPSAIRTKKDLENHIEEVAAEHGIDTNQPFPFLIEGKVKSADWHVINWKDGDTEHSHDKHIKSGLYGTIQNKAMEMLGFYSDSHHAIFTHHTTNMHIHGKLKTGEIAGHIDELELGEGMLLKLPKVD